MVRTNQLEIDAENDPDQRSGTWADLFRGANRYRTEITVMSLGAQLLCGDPFASSSLYFFEQAGMDAPTAFKFGFGNSAVALFANVLSYAVMTRVGLRTLYLWGLGLLAILLTIVGGLSIAGDRGAVGAKWGTAGVIYVSASSNRALRYSRITVVRLDQIHLYGSPLLRHLVRRRLHQASQQVDLVRALDFVVPQHYCRRFDAVCMLNPSAWNVS